MRAAAKAAENGELPLEPYPLADSGSWAMRVGWQAAHVLFVLLLAAVPGTARTAEQLCSPGPNLERSELAQLRGDVGQGEQHECNPG